MVVFGLGFFAAVPLLFLLSVLWSSVFFQKVYMYLNFFFTESIAV